MHMYVYQQCLHIILLTVTLNPSFKSMHHHSPSHSQRDLHKECLLNTV